MGIFGGLKRLKSSLFSVAGVIPEAKMALSTIVDDILVCSDGSMGTMVRLQGLRTMRNISDYEAFLTRLANRLRANLSVPGHAIQIYFQRDPSHARQLAQEMVLPARNAARFFDLELDREMDMREAMVANRVIPEVAYMVLWTRPAAIDPAVRKNLEKTSKHPPMWPRAENAQDVFDYTEKLATLHKAWVSDLLECLKQEDLSIPRLSGHEAIRAIRSSPRPGYTNQNWTPWLPSDELRYDAEKVLTRGDLPTRGGAGDLSDELWPNLVDAIFDGCDVQGLSGSHVRLGNTVWSSFQMNLGPRDQQPFSKLIKQVGQGDEIPWRASFTIETSVLNKERGKEMLASFAGITSRENSRPLYLALQAAREASFKGDVQVGVQAIFSTWASVGELRQKPRILEDRENRLQRSIESWGSIQVDTGGDPFETTMGGMLGINPVSPGTRTICPLKNALKFLPLDRDAAAMEKGANLFFTEYDTIFPWDEGSKEQLSGMSLFAAPPGSGKSSLVSKMMMAQVTSPLAQAAMSDRKLAFIGMIDIGYSQFGNIMKLQNALPAGRKNEAQYHRLQNEERFSINPFDTQPGLRWPLSTERMFLINFFTELVTPIGQKDPPARLAEFCSTVIDAAYAQCSDRRQDKGAPKSYYRGKDREADDLIDKFQIQFVEGRTTWWNIVDDLHKVGHPAATAAAILAQRNAMPLIEDLGKILSSPSIEQEWGQAKAGLAGETLIKMFATALSFVSKEFKILSRPTRFHLGAGRVVVLDLGSIANGDGPYAAKISTIAYMLARSVLTRGYYLSEDNLDHVPLMWRDYHEKMIQLYRDAPKLLIYDEFHMTINSPSVRAQLVIDARTGRKWGVHIQVISQSILDFDETMFENAASVYILGTANEDSVQRIVKKFNLSPVAAEKVRSGLYGPTRRGAPFLALYRMRDGAHEHYLINVKTAYELWTDSTTPEDVQIRSRVSRHLGFIEACFALSQNFPGGSARDEYNRLAHLNPEKAPMDMIAEQVVKDYHHVHHPAMNGEA